jgi:hypothetical protein
VTGWRPRERLSAAVAENIDMATAKKLVLSRSNRAG